MRKKQTIIAAIPKPTRCRPWCFTGRSDLAWGLDTRQRETTNIPLMQQAVKYGRAENLHHKAAANAAPRSKELVQFAGRSSHRVNVHRASITVAAHAISRVAKPAWPRIGGQQAMNAT